MVRLLALALAVPWPVAAAESGCFAFLLHGDVHVRCEGRLSRITTGRAVERFAVDEKRGVLAYVTADASFTAKVVDLGTGTVRRVEGVRELIASCGEVVGLAGKQEPRCSSDRRVVAGVNDAGELVVNGPGGSRTLARADDVNQYGFNVSPSGDWVAWYNSVRPLCLAALAGKTECVDHSTMTDAVSLNDSGEVLVATGTGRGCQYRTSYDFSPARTRYGGDDECLGIGFWKAGMAEIVFLEPIGRNPQWITRETAALLERWARQRVRAR